MKGLITGLAVFVWLLASGALARAQQPSDTDEVTLEDLMTVQVTSVSKKAEGLFGAPSAVYVLTRADIRRSGATSIPEALRLVPGISVAQIDGGKWAVTARGFNALHANKLLMLIDGRGVYSPLFAGVDWSIENMPLDDIDRIEVIRGPGAALWDVNSVNGVINVITRPAIDTQGAKATLGSGARGSALGSIRYGGKVGDGGHYRVYGQYLASGTFPTSESSADPGERVDGYQTGLRADFKLSSIDSVTLSGGISLRDARGRSALPTTAGTVETSRRTVLTHAQNIVGVWNHTPTPRSAMSLHISFDDSFGTLFGAQTDYDNFNFEFQKRSPIGRRHDLIWGVGHHFSLDHEDGSFALSFSPNDDRELLTDAYAHDEIAVTPRLKLTVGAKIQYENHVQEIELEPNVRLSWLPTAKHSLWAAVSRVTHAPSRADREMRLNYAVQVEADGGLPVLSSVLANPLIRPESLTAFEAGYRTEVLDRVHVDATVFSNLYDDLRWGRPVTFVEENSGPAHLVIGTHYENYRRAVTAGSETTINWDVLPQWKLEGGFSLLASQFATNESPGESIHVDSPARQWRLGSGIDLPGALRFDANLYHVSALEDSNVPAYTRLDARLNHEFTPNVSLAVVGQNLLTAHHREFGTAYGFVSADIYRTAHLKLTWQF